MRFRCKRVNDIKRKPTIMLIDLKPVSSTVLQARTDLKVFAEYCFGFKNTWFHNAWYDTIADRDIKSGLIIAPRNSAKSTCWSKVGALWLLGTNPDLRIVIVSRTSMLAQDDMRFIRLQVESNDRVREVFPSLIVNDRVTGLEKDSPWGEERITVKNNRNDGTPSVYATGLGGSISGIRADIIFVDDLIDQNNVMTEGQRNKVEEFWDTVVTPTLNPGGRIFAVGTRYHAKDFYARLLDDPMYRDNTFMFPALELNDKGELVLTPKLDDNGNQMMDEDGALLTEPISYWPARWNVNELLKMKERMGSLAFNSQYMCDPSGYAGQLFDPDNLQFYNPKTLESIWGNLDFVMSVDPNVTADPESDNTAIITGAVDRKNGKVYVMDIFAKPLDFVNQVTAMKKYGNKTSFNVGTHIYEATGRISKIGVEAVAYQRSLQQTGYLSGLPVVELKQRNQNKEIRILGMYPHIENGRVMFPNPHGDIHISWWDKFLEEYSTFNKGRRDDMLDGLEMLISMVSSSFGVSGIPWGPGQEMENEQRWSRRDGWRPDI